MLNLTNVKQYLKVDYNDEDTLIQGFIDVAESYLYSLTNKVEEFSEQHLELKSAGKEVSFYTESQLKLAELYCLAFVAELYNNRSLTIDKVEQNLRYVYQSILTGLMYGGE